jgi:hypothetical protein
LVWLVLVLVVVYLGISGVIPAEGLQRRFVAIAFLEAELFFFVVLWPIFLVQVLPPVSSCTPTVRSSSGQLYLALLYLVLLLLISLPVAVVALGVSYIDVRQFLKPQLLVFVIALSVVGVLAVSPRSPRRVLRWYFLGVTMVGVVLPFCAFLLRCLAGAGRGYQLAYTLSPFWVVANVERELYGVSSLAIQLGLFGFPALVCFCVGLVVSSRAGLRASYEIER